MRTLTSWGSLQPLVGTTSESADLDFKATLDPSKGKIEFAKDVAALANVMGGHVLVGVSTDMNGTRCTGFRCIARERATRIATVFEEQVKDRCRPTPIFAVQALGPDVDSKDVVLVITVEASARAPIGVLLRQNNGGALVDKGWAFPYRVGSLTEYLHPDQFGVYESMTARRAAAILNTIPLSERGRVVLRWAEHAAVSGNGWGDGQTSHLQSMTVQYHSVDLLGNAASFSATDGAAEIDLPLDRIQTVWRTAARSGNPVWAVSIDGSLQQTEGEWQYWPPG